MKKIFFAALVCMIFSIADGYAQQSKPVTGILTNKTSGKDRTAMEYYSMITGLAGNRNTVDPLCANNGYDALIKSLQALLAHASTSMKADILKAIAKARAAQRRCPGYHSATALNIAYSHKTIQSGMAVFSTQSAL